MPACDPELLHPSRTCLQHPVGCLCAQEKALGAEMGAVQKAKAEEERWKIKQAQCVKDLAAATKALDT